VFVHILSILCQVKASPFDGLFPALVLLGCKTLREIVLDGRLKLRAVVLVFPTIAPYYDELGQHYDQEMRDMQLAIKAYKKRYAKVYSVVGVKAAAPTDEAASTRFYRVLSKVLGAHAGTVEVLCLTLTFATRVAVLYKFLDVVRSCENVTNLKMDMTGIISNRLCTQFLARQVESVVQDMQKLLHLSWTGFFYERVMHQTEWTPERTLLLHILPESIVSLRLAGQVSYDMNQKNRHALLHKFGHNELQNLVVVDLNAYRHDDHSFTSLHLYTRLSDVNSNVARVILPAEWTSNFKVMGDVSIESMLSQGKELLGTGKRFTVVVSNTNAVEREAQVRYITDIMHAQDKPNVSVEWVGMHA
jgi:hypothetical protein